MHIPRLLWTCYNINTICSKNVCCCSTNIFILHQVLFQVAFVHVIRIIGSKLVSVGNHWWYGGRRGNCCVVLVMIFLKHGGETKTTTSKSTFWTLLHHTLKTNFSWVGVSTFLSIFFITTDLRIFFFKYSRNKILFRTS